MQINLVEIIPQSDAVFQSQGIRRGTKISNNVHELFTEAITIFTARAQPVGLVCQVSKKEFELIFKGEGKNDQDAPIQHIYTKAGNLALFALTMGNAISLKIQQLFNDNHFALATMLDAVASQAADNAVEVYEDVFFQDLLEQTSTNSDFAVSSYCPGYCGWHVSGQKKLFQVLHPETIGISLNTSYLMTPLKSVSGVLIGGKKEIHFFDSDYPFCKHCKTYSCHIRMKNLLNR